MAKQGSFKLEEGERITAVMVNHGHIVDGVGFEITDKSGNSTNKLISYSNRGSLTEYIALDANEHITQISGTYGKYYGNDIYIATIKIHTNLNPVGYGPYGQGQETQDIKSFSTPLPLDGPIVGFFTSYGPYLASIGIYAEHKVITKRHGPYGNQESSPNWSFELQEGERITKVLVNHGYVVDGVGFEITDAKGNTVLKNFGGSGGSRSQIPLGPYEYITQISGEYGHYYNAITITKIKIHTNLRPNGYGPYGESKNANNVKPFSTPLPLASAVVGFFGFYGTYLGSIGIYAENKMAERHGPYGNEDSSPNWSFELAEGERITKVLVNHGYVVDGVGFEITDAKGNTVLKNFSGSGGSRSEIALSPDEYITQISGEYGHYYNTITITKIKIHTNLRPNGYGPYGESKNANNVKPFSTPLPLASATVGFFGFYGTYLGSIGIYAKNKMAERHGPYGNENTSPNWSFELEEGERITKVLVNHGYVVDGVGFEKTNAKGNTILKKFSGSGGSRSEIPLGPDEYITQISGEYGQYYNAITITKIKIHTNLRPNGYGPYGESKNVNNVKPFSTPLPLAGAIVGFFGFYGTYFGSIGIINKHDGVKKYGPYGRA